MRVPEVLYLTVAHADKKTYNFGFLEVIMSAKRVARLEKMYGFDKLQFDTPRIKRVPSFGVRRFRMACYAYGRLTGVSMRTAICNDERSGNLVGVQVTKRALAPIKPRSPGNKHLKIETFNTSQLRGIPFSRMRKDAILTLRCASHGVLVSVYNFLRQELATADHYYSIYTTRLFEVVVRCVMRDKRTRLHNQKKQRNRYPFVNMKIGDRLYFYPPQIGVQYPTDSARSACEYAEERYDMEIAFRTEGGFVKAWRIA